MAENAHISPLRLSPRDRCLDMALQAIMALDVAEAAVSGKASITAARDQLAETRAIMTRHVQELERLIL